MTMENDLVERLRRQYRDGLMFLPDDFKIVGYDEAAVRIQALEAELARKTEALRDIADAASSFRDENGDEVAGQVILRARSALEEKTDV